MTYDDLDPGIRDVVPVPDFYASNEAALADLVAGAARDPLPLVNSEPGRV